MGIEQSSYQSPQPRTGSTVSESGGAIPRSKPRQDANESGRSSPHPSVCSSDADVPYVSYTVNKPIGGTLFSFYTLNYCYYIIHFAFRVSKTFGEGNWQQQAWR